MIEQNQLAKENVIVVGNENLILVDVDDKSQLIIGETGLNFTQ